MLQSISLGDPRWSNRALHGCSENDVWSIVSRGLVPGFHGHGGRGKAHKRAHNHFVKECTSSKDQPGLRNGSTAVYEVDLLKYYEDGNEVPISDNDVYLTTFMHPR